MRIRTTCAPVHKEDAACDSASQPLAAVPNRAPCCTSPLREKSQTGFTSGTDFTLILVYARSERYGKKKMQLISRNFLSWSEGR